jgi:hypothetical protein
MVVCSATKAKLALGVACLTCYLNTDLLSVRASEASEQQVRLKQKNKPNGGCSPFHVDRSILEPARRAESL